MMDKNYIVGDLIYDAAIYDGLNTFLDDLEFYKKWLPKDKEARILELCCGTGRLTIPIAKEGYKSRKRTSVNRFCERRYKDIGFRKEVRLYFHSF